MEQDATSAFTKHRRHWEDHEDLTTVFQTLILTIRWLGTLCSSGACGLDIVKVAWASSLTATNLYVYLTSFDVLHNNTNTWQAVDLEHHNNVG